jgi:hypothetical protein
MSSEVHSLAIADLDDREAVVRFLEGHGLGGLVPPSDL